MTDQPSLFDVEQPTLHDALGTIHITLPTASTEAYNPPSTNSNTINKENNQPWA